MRAALLLVLVAGCWRNTGAEEPEVAAREKGATCDEVAAQSREILATSTEPNLAPRADQIGRVIAQRCVADAWSIELRRCLAGAKTLDDTDGCEQIATPEQRQALQHEIEMTENAE